MSKLTLGAASLNLIPLDWTHNTRVIKNAIADARDKGVDLLCLPELCIPGYGCQDMFFHPWVSEKSIRVLHELLPETKDMFVSFGLTLWFETKLYNVAAFVENGSILGFSAKQNLAEDGIYYEPRWFEKWMPARQESIQIDNKAYPIGELIYNVKGYKVAFEICEDAWRQVRPAINHQKNGVDIILNPSASHFEMDKFLIRERLMTSSSEKFGCTFIYSNLLGNESGKIIYDGDTLIAKDGKILARGARLQMTDHILTVFNTDNDTNQVLPAEDKPSRNKQFLDAEMVALMDYLRKSRSRCFVVSLSGGADSACCAVLVAMMVKKGIEVLGERHFAERIGRKDLLNLPASEWTSQLLICAYQSTRNSTDLTRNAARTLASGLQATFFDWSVDEEVQGAISKVEKAIGRKLTWEGDDITLQNVQARMRSPFIWILANLYNGLLLTTSNRSEGDVGYATMDGDTSGSVAPLAGIDKVFIRQWLKWAEKELDLPCLAPINAQIPTAELRPHGSHQSDEDDLMPYPILLFIERKFLKERLHPSAITEAVASEYALDPASAKAYVRRFLDLWTRNQWKRERMAPGFHVDDFSIDPKSWLRFPILSGGFREEL